MKPLMPQSQTTTDAGGQALGRIRQTRAIVQALEEQLETARATMWEAAHVAMSNRDRTGLTTREIADEVDVHRTVMQTRYRQAGGKVRQYAGQEATANA